MHGFVHRNIKLSVYPQLFVVSLDAEIQQPSKNWKLWVKNLFLKSNTF